MAGNYQKDMSFGSFTLPTADDYYSRLFLCRVSSSHQIQWLKDLPIEQGNYGDDLGLAIDDDQNIYLTGTDDGKIFLTKFDSLGTKLWRNDFGGKVYGYGRAIALDQFDNIYVTGGSGWGFFMAKLDYNGNTVWTKDIWVNYSDGCKISDIQVDAMGNIYFAGTYGIDKLVLDQFTITHDGGWGDNIVFGKMNTDGHFIWVKSITGYLSEPHIKLTHDGHLYMAGGFAEWMVLPEIFLYGPCCNETAPFIAKFKIDGTYEWAKTANSYDGKGVIVDLSTDYDGNLYTTGSFFTCYGSFCTENDYYIEKYDKDGQNLWRQEFAMATSDFTKSIDIDNKGYLYLMGANQSSSFIDANSYSNTITLGVGQFDTKASTYKRTPRPSCDKFFWQCAENENIQIVAGGQNVQWYSDAAITQRIHSGNTYTPMITDVDTVYVTQTVNGIESWPKAVVLFPPISSKGLVLKNNSLIAPKNNFYTYQWFYNQDSIKNATNFSIDFNPEKSYEMFSVVITEGKCVKTLKGSDSLVTGVLPENLSGIVCFPNPTTGTIKLYTPNRSGITFQVLNVFGMEITPSTSYLVADESYEIDLSDQPAGTYLIKAAVDNVVQVKKVVKR